MSVLVADLDRWNSLQAKALETKLAEAFEACRSNGYEPILIKGWAIAQKYPNEHIRRPGDIDLAIDTKDFEEFLKFTRQPDVSKFNIDVHNGLRYLDSVDWSDLYDHSVLIDLNGTPIRILCEEDHLRVLCTHWLVDGGSFKDKLWDIYYAIENRKPDFSWDRCLNVVSSIRRGWVICSVALAHKYLDLEISDLPFSQELEYIPKWITRCVEREWARKERLEPILTSTHDKRLLLHQIARRLPPNPIRSTIEAEGDLYGNRRMIYQAKVLGRRALPFARDSLKFAKIKLRGNTD
jgi:hypothetical protein